MTALASNLRTSRRFLDWRVASLYAAVVAGSLPIWPFGWHLGLHVLGAAMLIGNAVVMAIWLTLAGFLGSDAAKRRAARVVNVGDAWFTIPGVALLLLNGLAMVFARYGGFAAFTTTGWIAAGLVLLTATGVIWASQLLPAQLTLLRLARAAGPLDRAAFRRVLNRWYAWGTAATVLPLLAAFVMTTKPSF